MIYEDKIEFFYECFGIFLFFRLEFLVKECKVGFSFGIIWVIIKL